jgi:hypothetical protein
LAKEEGRVSSSWLLSQALSQQVVECPRPVAIADDGGMVEGWVHQAHLSHSHFAAAEQWAEQQAPHHR